MRVHLAGTRGSTVVTGPAAGPFGGDTTCLQVIGADGSIIVIDCGSGLGSVGRRVGTGVDALILLTHFHLDHLLGLGTFAPLLDATARLTIASPTLEAVTAEAAVRGLFAPPYWPVGVQDMAATVAFENLASPCATPRAHGGLRVTWSTVPHPGGCAAYRIDEPSTGAAVVMATDVEWDVGDDEARARLVALCRDPRPADLLIHDGQYDEGDSVRTRGWGHATGEDAIRVARAAGVAHLLVTHHDPTLDGPALMARERRLRAIWPRTNLARQGQEFVLGKDVP